MSRTTDILLTALAPTIWGSTYLVTTEALPAGYPVTVAALRAPRTSITIPGDNITALSMVAKTTGSPGGINKLAMELGLMLGGCNYQPMDGVHIPGLANVFADILSRKHDPNKRYEIPEAPRAVPETVLDRRDSRWYRAHAAPAAP